MSDEIKEILEDVKRHLDYVEATKQASIRDNEMKVMYDYITNLQERKITKEDVDKYFEENMCVSFDKFIENWKEQEEWTNYYKEENQRLKEENKRIFSKVNDDELLISNAMNYAEAQDYKSRCEKAIEYINKNIVINFDKVGFDTNQIAGIVVDKLLEILQGGDEE